MNTPDGYLRLQVATQDDADMLAQACGLIFWQPGTATAEGRTVLLPETHYSMLCSAIDGAWDQLHENLCAVDGMPTEVPAVPNWIVLAEGE